MASQWLKKYILFFFRHQLLAGQELQPLMIGLYYDLNLKQLFLLQIYFFRQYVFCFFFINGNIQTNLFLVIYLSETTSETDTRPKNISKSHQVHYFFD